MVYNELCHKEIDWSMAMKELLITLVAVVLGITAMSSYAKDDHKQRQDAKTVNVLERKGDNKFHSAQSYLESNSELSDEGKKKPRPASW